MSNHYGIPSHLPKRLTISFWLWNYFYGMKKGDVFHNLEQRFVELKERGFNTIRIDSGAGLHQTPQGKPRGAIVLHKPFGEYSTLRQLYFKHGGGRCDVMKRILELFTLARQYDVHVILSSWFYLHTFWFVSPRLKEALYTLPVAERFMYFAREYDHLIGRLKEKGLHRQIAFVEIFNEFNHFAHDWRLVTATSSAAEKRAVFNELRRGHEEALAFLRDRHPDILWALDTAGAGETDILPRNAQVWNQHYYYCWIIYFTLLENYIQDENFDFAHAFRHPVIGRFLNNPTADIAAIRRSQHHDLRIDEGWYRRVWLFNSLNPKILPDLERRFRETLSRDIAQYRKYAEENITAGVKARDSLFPGMPLVMGEGATYCGHMGMRWEEQSDTYWSLIEYNSDQLKKNGYWGCVPRTNSGPEDPSWTEYPERLRHANERFLSP